MTQKKTIIMFLSLLGLIVVTSFVVWGQGGDKVVSRVDLDRPLVVGIVSWPGYAGGILANGGFQENETSIYTKKYGLPVRFVLIEDIDARGKAFARGGPDGVDVMWTTVDFWANELPNFAAGGIDARAFLQVDWSRGGDAIVANEDIKSVEDLRGKKTALVEFTPSHWMLESALAGSSLSEQEKSEIRDNLVFTQDVQSARATFTAGRVDAAVVWEPDVRQALKYPGSHILTSTKDFPDIIADVLVAKKEFIDAHPQTMEAFVRGWLDGVEMAKEDLSAAAQVLMENEPLFQDLGLEKTEIGLSWVYWPDLEDNAEMFGLDGERPVFDDIFSQAGLVWKSLGVVSRPLSPQVAKDDSILRKIYESR